MLQHDRQRDAGALAGGNDCIGARGVRFERLLEQHVLAGGGKAFDQRQMRARRRQDQRRTDRRIVGQRIEIAGHRKIEARCEIGRGARVSGYRRRLLRLDRTGREGFAHGA